MDIDGTVADCSHRLPTLTRIDEWHLHPSSTISIDDLWKDFYYQANKDEPVVGSLRGVMVLVRNFKNLTYVTGRSGLIEQLTREWLFGHGFPNAPLVMRSETDNRPSVTVKKDLVQKFVGERILGVDDDPKILEMYHSLGFATLWAPYCWASLQE